MTVVCLNETRQLVSSVFDLLIAGLLMRRDCSCKGTVSICVLPTFENRVLSATRRLNADGVSIQRHRRRFDVCFKRVSRNLAPTFFIRKRAPTSRLFANQTRGAYVKRMM